MVKTIIWKKLTSVLLRGVSTGFWTNAIRGPAPARDSGRGLSLCFQSDIGMGVGSPRQEKCDFIWHPPAAGSPPLRWTWGCFCNPFLILRLWELTRTQPDTGQIFLMSDLIINANSQLYVGPMVSAADGVGSPRRNVSTTQALPWPSKSLQVESDYLTVWSFAFPPSLLLGFPYLSLVCPVPSIKGRLRREWDTLTNTWHAVCVCVCTYRHTGLYAWCVSPPFEVLSFTNLIQRVCI